MNVERCGHSATISASLDWQPRAPLRRSPGDEHVSEGIRVVVLGIGFLVIFTALGLGLACALARTSSPRIVLAPLLGLAVAASVLTTASLGLTMRSAAWVVLVPLGILSLGLVVWQLRRGRRIDLTEAAIPAVLVVVGLLLASAPALARDTVGPFGLGVYDALGYIQTDLWLQGHTLLDEPPPDSGRWDLTLAYGHALTQDETRIGVSVVNAAVAGLFGLRPDETIFAFLAALFALVPAAVWVVARRLGAGRSAAAFGACFGLSPAVFTLVADSALANLTAVVLAPPALALALQGLERRRTDELLLAAVLLAGMIAVFPEFIPPFAVAAAVGVAAYAVRLVLRSRSWAYPRVLVAGLALLGAGVAVLAPLALYRALSYLSRIGGDTALFSGLPPRFMTLENGGAWAFGVLHIYQLQRFDLLSGSKTALAIALPLALAVLVAVGSLRSLRAASLILVPIGTSIGLGLLAYRRYQDGHCEYCLWKSLTFMLPFLGVGLALGVAAAWRMSRWLRPAVVVLALVAVGVLARTDLKVARALEHTPAASVTGLRELDDGNVPVAEEAHVLVEGAEASSAPKWTVPEAYYTARGLHGARPSLPLARDDALYLGLGAANPPDQLYAPSYDYVLSAFPGVRSGRTPLVKRGTHALFRRAPTDVAIVGASSALDPAEGREAIPWVLGPLQLWISAPRSRRAAVLVRLRHREGERPLLQLLKEGRRLPTFSAADRSSVCAETLLGRGLTILTAQPDFPSRPPLPRATEEEPVPPPPKVLGIEGVEVRPGRCPAGRRATMPFLQFGAGWHVPERDARGRVFRWMRSRAQISVGAPNAPRPRARLHAKLSSLLRPRVLTVRIDGTTRRIRIPRSAMGYRRLALFVPAGRGPARITLTADPGAESASAVTPGDARRLAIVFSEVQLRVARTGAG
jgi:hypothetical protein